MSGAVGAVFAQEKLYLTKGRDFKWAYELVDRDGNPVDFPPGRLYYEFGLCPDTKTFDFSISGSVASIKIEHEDADLIPNRTCYQLVFLHADEPAGGDPVSMGTVQRQGC